MRRQCYGVGGAIEHSRGKDTDDEAMGKGAK